jgi:hypothetical protein
VPYGIIVLPEKPVADRIVDYSRRLGAAGGTSMLLGADAPAHLSIAHFDGAQAAAQACWAVFSRAQEAPAASPAAPAASPAGVPVELVGLAFKPLPPGDYYVPDGGVAVSLEAENTDVLTDLRDRAVGAVRGAGAGLLGRRSFRPHLTLAVFRQPRIGGFDVDPALVRSSFAGLLAFGRLGPYGTFPQILARL